MIPSLGTRPFFFVHVPKTAGTSFTGLLGARFAPAETLCLRGRPANQVDALLVGLDDYLFVHGHLPYDLRRRFHRAPFVFTLLRDPIERAISAFYHLGRDATAQQRQPQGEQGPDARARAVALAGRTSLVEFVRADERVGAWHLGNRQVSMLSQPYAPGCQVMQGVTLPRIGAADLARACENLVACDCFGLTERLPETVELLSHAMRSELLGYPGWANRTATRPAVQELDSETLALLHELTEQDQLLYRFGATLFEQRRRAMLRGLLAVQARSTDPGGTPATRVSSFHFDRAIPGEGWYAPEQSCETWFSWTGPDRESWLMLRSPACGGDARLEIDVVHAVQPEQLFGTGLRVNDWPVAREVAGGSMGHCISAAIPAWLLRPQGEANRIHITVDRPVRPCDFIPPTPDSRLLGLAISRVALCSADAVPSPPDRHVPAEERTG